MVNAFSVLYRLRFKQGRMQEHGRNLSRKIPDTNKQLKPFLNNVIPILRTNLLKKKIFDKITE